MTDADRAGELIVAWREAAEQGRYVAPEALIAEHPELAEQLRLHFSTQGVLDQFFAEADAQPASAPEVLGDYRLGREIGRGGMGVVYEAEQVSMGRLVAVKVLFPTIATTAATRKRFEREARITGHLHHTNIVTVYAMGQQDGYLYFAMERVNGVPLDQVIANLAATEAGAAGRTSVEGLGVSLRGAAGTRRLARMFSGAADALQVAHAQGVIHRDMKPSNLILDQERVLKVTDFGLAKLVGDQVGMTRTGDVLGTPLYMSPEQMRGRKDGIDHRTDIYSLGATLYEALSGERPFDGEDVAAVCAAVLSESPKPLAQVAPDLPRDLVTIVEKAMAREPADRYGSAADFAADLRAFAAGRAIHARRLGVARRAWRSVKRHRVRSTLVVLVLGIAAAALGLGWQGRETEAQRRELEYFDLIRQADAAYGFRVDQVRISPAEVLYEKAIAFAPSRPEAWFARAIGYGGEHTQRLTDIEEAEARGMSGRAIPLARAWVYRLTRQAEAAREQEAKAGAAVAPSQVERYLEALITHEKGDRGDALRSFVSLVADRELSPRLRRRCLLRMAAIEEQGGELARAVEHLSAAFEGVHVPMDVEVRTAALWDRLGQHRSAERRFARVLEQLGTIEEPYQWEIMLHNVVGHGPAAWIRRVAQAGIELLPDAPALRFYEAIGYWREGQSEKALAAAQKGLERWPQNGLFHFVIGKVMAQRHRHAEAATALQACVELLPQQAPEPWFDLAEALLRLRRYEDALRACKKGQALAPANAIGHLVAGRIHGKLGDAAAAEQAFRRALEISPAATDARLALARVLASAGRPDEALAVLDQGLGKSPREILLRTERQRVLRAAGREDAWREDVEAMRSEAEQLLAHAPDSPRLQHQRALALQTLGLFKEAVAAYDAALALDEGDDETDKVLWHDRGTALYQGGDRDGALASMRRAVALDPNYPAPRAAIGQILKELGQNEEALVALETALPMARTDEEAGTILYNLGESLRALGRPAKAEERYRAGLELTPRDPDLWAGLAIAQFEQDRPEEAVESARRGVAIDAQHANLQNNLAVMLMRMGRYAEARKAYEALVALTPEDADAHAGLAYVLMMLEEFEQALPRFDRALALDGTQLFTFFNRALVRWALGQDERAQAELRRVHKALPDHPGVMAALAECLANCTTQSSRKPEEARRLAEAAVQATPDAPGAQAALAWARLRSEQEPATVIQAFQAALKDPEFGRGPDPWYGLAIAGARAGLLKEARAWKAKGDAALAARPSRRRGVAALQAEAAKAVAGPKPAPDAEGR